MTNAPTEFEYVALDDILAEDRSREVDEAWAEALAEEFKLRGMLNPITLWRSPEGPFLVAGAHRLAAHRINDEAQILARFVEAETLVDAKVLEITENIVRRELSALDKAQHLFDLKEAYEALHPEAKKGGDRKSKEARQNQKEIISFRSDVAETVGLSERAISMSVAMWKGLTGRSRTQVRGTWMADHQANLMQLSKLDAKTQAKVLGMIFPANNKPPQATSVAEALFILENGRALSANEKKFSGIQKTLTAMDDRVFDALMTTQEERVVAWYKRTHGGEQ